MSERRKKDSRGSNSGALTRRQFMKLTGVSAASGAISWPGVTLFAAQPGRKRIVLHGERQVTSLGYHNRRETEHVSMVDAGLVGQNPVTLERVRVLAEELPSVKKGMGVAQHHHYSGRIGMDQRGAFGPWRGIIFSRAGVCARRAMPRRFALARHAAPFAPQFSLAAHCRRHP